MTAKSLRSKHSIGWIGLGRMGEAMALRLYKAGCDLAVWNRTRAKADPLAAQGVKVVDEISALSSRDIVFTMVSDTEDLAQVLFGKGGLLAGKKRPQLVVDCSSISDDGSAGIRSRVEALGTGYLCAPVSGNAKVCKAGKLWVVSSGPRKLHVMAEPYLRMLGRGVTYVGAGELARIWKIAHNTMFGVVIQNLCEITVLAEKAGIPRDVFLESINNSVLGSMYTRYKTPVLVNLDFDKVTFTPKLLLKDMDLGMGAAKRLGVPMPAAAATRESVQNLVGRGYDHVDFSVLLVEQAKAAGLVLKPGKKKIDDGL
jgi:3-hydroxyisobutyrate dehydrogenase